MFLSLIKTTFSVRMLYACFLTIPLGKDGFDVEKILII